MPQSPLPLPAGGPVLLPDPTPELALPVAAPLPRVLIVTPELAAAPMDLSPRAHQLSAKAGGLADVSTSLLKGLKDLGAHVHLTVPNYRRIFDADAATSFKHGLAESALPESERRLHLAEDRSFYYRSHIYGGPEGHLAALAFQREVINNIITRVRPDLIHCHDWMTGLIPALARKHGIPCLFTVHNIHTERLTLALMEDRGIDTASFWQNLYFDWPPGSYEETREHNCCDLLASGIFAADHVNVVSPHFLSEIVDGHHDGIPHSVRSALQQKAVAGCASGILNAPDATYHPEVDPFLRVPYGPAEVEDGKVANKVSFQRRVGLNIDPDAPLLFWPSRLDPVQKGCQLFTDLLYQVVSDYAPLGLQVAAVANGPHECHLHDIIRGHGLEGRAVCCGFEEGLSRQAFAAADFVLMPSLFEPCGLPQMIGPKYGALPIARNTGGLHDTVQPLEIENHRGNGFRFDHYNKDGFRWAIDRAIEFFRLSREVRNRQLSRIMNEAAREFSEHTMIANYVELYELILERPLTQTQDEPPRGLTAPFPVPHLHSQAAAAPDTISVAV